VKPEYLLENDQRLLSKFGIDTAYPLQIDLHMKELVRIDDLYHDKSTFVKTLQ